MNEMKINWDDLHLFLAVARAGGLSGAARETGKSAPTLGRRMQALEQATGSELFLRHARGYELTEEGHAFLTRVTDIENRIIPLNKSTGQDGQIVVKISAGSWMTHALCTRASDILKGASKTRLRFISAERELNISHREAIIGIRNRRPDQIGLACQKVGQVRFAGYATERDVTTWVQVTNKTPSARWVAAHTKARPAMEVSAPRNALDLARSGAARAILPSFVGDPDPALRRVTGYIHELTHDQWLVTHQDDRFRPEVRQTIDNIRAVVRSLHTRPD